jgi:hypothetical protein
MTTQDQDYQLFDRIEVTNLLFHPRSESGVPADDQGFRELTIPVGEQVAIGGRLYTSGRNAPILLFFHGNGEIVEDYDDIGRFYQRVNVNFLAVDYRGYGTSTGHPGVSSMMNDCSAIFTFVVSYLQSNGYTGAIIVMGRSLGSASALELVTRFPDRIDGLIIESGFAFALPLMRLVGIDIDRLGINDDIFANDKKIAGFTKPTLIIHAEFDHIIPFSDGERLYDQSGDKAKKLLKIPGANHNDILARGLESYMKEVRTLIERSIKLKAKP